MMYIWLMEQWERLKVMSDWSEADYNKWRDYLPGVYKGRDLFGKPHPSNVCSFKSHGHSVLISLETEHRFNPTTTRIYPTLDDEVPKRWAREDATYKLIGYRIHVWSKKNSIISESYTVKSLDQIERTITRLRAKVTAACHHEGNNTVIASPYRHEHKFLCLDCNEEWGYDSSG